MKLLVFFLLTLTSFGHAALLGAHTESWRKPLQESSKAEAEALLEKSPWVQKQEVRITYAGTTRRIAGGSVPSTLLAAYQTLLPPAPRWEVPKLR